ncbi:MAG: DNA polymerase III subunit gamma/tau [Clostridium sp.]|nr:MAG: DNA polymerase III subunit gamma/tau [Clostridium sp.]
MAYVALYRAYRPQKFGEVVGQKHIVTTLQNAIRLNKVAHAYLFSGPRGTGKTTIAKILAKALNCESGPAIEPCGTCFLCEGITKGTIPDVVELDAASNNGADDIRVIRDSVKFMPSVARYKVYIIDEVHMLSNAAFNALLKTLEEPPKHVIFILATTEPYKLPATILSRCQRFDFQAITDNEIFNRLNVVCKAEKINATDEALGLIAQSAEGGMRDALSLLDACISYSTDDVVDINDVLAVSGNVSSELFIRNNQ